MSTLKDPATALGAEPAGSMQQPLLGKDSSVGSLAAAAPLHAVKDSRGKAIIFMNLFAVGGVGQALFFKLAMAEGARVFDYQVFRNVGLLIVAAIQMACSKLGPVRSFPWAGHTSTLFWRCLTGQVCFFLFNFCLQLVPLTLQLIVFQTGTFWTSILAYCVFSEQMIPLEIVSMLVCFAGMVTITIAGAKNAKPEDGSAVEETNYSSSQLILGYSLVLTLSWVYASNCILNRALKGINSGVIMFWHGVLGAVLAVAAVAVEFLVKDLGEGSGLHMFNMSAKCAGLMLAATMGDTLAVNSVTIAFQSDSSGFVSLISYISVIYAFLGDCLIFQESFTWVELAAAFAILLVTVGTAVVKLRESGRARRLSRADSFTSADDLNRSIVRAE